MQPLALPAGRNQVWEWRSLVTALKGHCIGRDVMGTGMRLIFRDYSVSHHADRT